MTLSNKSVFITGASRGIGKAIALKLAQQGACITIAAKTTKPHPKLEGTIYTAAREIEQAGGKALPIAVDVRDEQLVEAAMATAAKEFGGIDILINNASAIFLAGTLQTPMKRFDLMHSVNVRATYLCAQKAIPYLLKAENPHILNLSPPPQPRYQMVSKPHRLYYVQVRHEHVRARHGRRVSQQGHRRQRPVATHHHRHRRRAQYAWW